MGDEPAGDVLTAQSGMRSARVRIGIGAGIVILIVAMVIAVAVNAFAQRGSESEIAADTSSTAGLGGQPTAPAAAEVLVHVLGAVNRPGLVSLKGGARVMDAVAASGGLTDDAEVSGINLARPLSDGEQLVVPRVGEVIAPPASGVASGGEAGTLVNLNTADLTHLQSLQGIGPALAQRILDWRTANGRFAAPADLLKVSGIGQKLFDSLKDQVTV